ncbi:acyltransferase family protein [Pontibacter sp. 13R65]|uniref:acyltransferase family protein n=1 Tax=Pontibacter sp. 13R65 TaxID=3127458 RepID=UPI00301BE31F
MNYSLELIRFIAVVLITFTHTRHNFSEGPAYYILEVLPTYGTLILSVVSGYLFCKHSLHKEDFFQRKVQSLLYPFLIANTLVLIPVLLLHSFGYNILNRIPYDYRLIQEGVFSLNVAPINPPTYFIRDLFVVFAIIELIVRKNYKMLILLIPLLVFGKLMLRYEILLLFSIGASYAYFEKIINKRKILICLLLITALSFCFSSGFTKYFISLLLFLLLIDLPVRFFDVGGYTYLLHLYHAPIIIIILPVLTSTVENDNIKVLLQISASLVVTFLLYLLTRKFVRLKIISGGR